MTPREEITKNIEMLNCHVDNLNRAWKTGDVKQFAMSSFCMQNTLKKAEEMLKDYIFTAYLKDTPLP